MAQQRLTESPEKMKQRIGWREPRTASAPSGPGGLHPLLQLQRTMGNRAVAARLERWPATKDERRAPVQRWPFWPPPATEAACRRLRRLGAPGLRPPLQPQELLRRPGQP